MLILNKKILETMRASSLLSVVFALLVAACGGGGREEKTQISIQGYWKLVKGLRNQRETETLQGVFFQFDADGKMMTNLPVGADVPTEYELKKNEIHQKTPQPVVYVIQSATDSMLVLTLELRGAQFEMHLQKTTPSDEGEESQDDLSQPSDSLSE